MEENPVKNHQKVEPKNKQPLGLIPFLDSTHPLGGINPNHTLFDKIGKELLTVIIEQLSIETHHKTLEIGCGTGRIAKQLIPIIGTNYFGLDVNKNYIEYCEKTYPAHFTHIDINNSEYNIEGTIDQHKFKLPYDDQSFDNIISIATFNHLSFRTIAQYLRESARLLKPKGKILFTAHLINNVSRDHINNKQEPPYSFKFKSTDGWSDWESRPLFNIAHHEELLRRVCMKHKLIIKEPIRYGNWCMSPLALSGPDVVVIRKNGWN